MADLSLFMKRRIQQLIDEYQDPQMVLEQLQNAAGDMTEQEEEEIADYISEIFSETPYDEVPLDDDPIDFLQHLLDSNGELNFSEEDEKILEEMLDIVEYGYEQAEENAFIILDKQAKKSRDTIRKRKVDLSSFKDTVTSLPLMKDTQTLIEAMVNGSLILNLKRNEEINMAGIKRIHSILSESPFVKGTMLPSKKHEFTYISLLPDLMRKAGLLQIDKKTLKVSPVGKKLVSSEDIDLNGIYWEFFMSLFLKNKETNGSSSYHSPSIEDFDYCILTAMLRIGEEWNDYERAVMPVLIEGNDFVKNSMNNVGFNIDLLNIHLTAFMETEEKFYEIMGLWETREQEGSKREIRLTSMGRYLIEKTVGYFSIPCRVYAEMLTYHNYCNYLNLLISSNERKHMKLLNTKAHKDYEEALGEMNEFYLYFLDIVTHHQNNKKELTEMELSAKEVIEAIKENTTRMSGLI